MIKLIDHYFSYLFHCNLLLLTSYIIIMDLLYESISIDYNLNQSRKAYVYLTLFSIINLLSFVK